MHVKSVKGQTPSHWCCVAWKLREGVPSRVLSSSLERVQNLEVLRQKPWCSRSELLSECILKPHSHQGSERRANHRLYLARDGVSDWLDAGCLGVNAALRFALFSPSRSLGDEHRHIEPCSSDEDDT
ncbi:hypothetical protein TNCV_3312461 [Trichonephila clavipes]|nr:hypothetical protein TNCV_3312461 [Trichonephila clavipes]